MKGLSITEATIVDCRLILAYQVVKDAIRLIL
jgi:hypothetical protein